MNWGTRKLAVVYTSNGSSGVFPGQNLNDSCIRVFRVAILYVGNGHLCRGPSYVEFHVQDVRLSLQRLRPDECRLRDLDIISLVI
jgi:hypothetical protein